MAIAAALALAAAAAEFPADPAGIDVIDRAFLRTYAGEEEHVFYLCMMNSEEGGVITIQELQGDRWETVCSWHPENMLGEPVVFGGTGVLSVQEAGGSLLVTWIDRISSYEGMAALYLDYGILQGQWQDYWVD